MAIHLDAGEVQMLVHCFALMMSSASCVLGQDHSGEDWNQTVKELAKQRQKILNALEEEKSWTDPKKAAALNRMLQAAAMLPDARLAPILVKRIAYSPWTEKRFKLRPAHVRWPAYGVLLRIGTPSIEPALEELTRIGPEKHEAALLLHLIVDIYQEGKWGFGKDLAIQRFELELAKAKDAKSRNRLESGLKWLRRGPEIKNAS